MSSFPQIGFKSGNSALTVNDGGTGASSGTQTAFSYLLSVDIPTGEVEKAEISGLWMSNITKQYLPAAIDPKMVKAKIQYVHADYVRLAALQGVLHTFVVNIATDGVSAGSATFSGWVSSFNGGPVEYDKVIPIEIEITLTGAITFA